MRAPLIGTSIFPYLPFGAENHSTEKNCFITLLMGFVTNSWLLPSINGWKNYMIIQVLKSMNISLLNKHVKSCIHRSNFDNQFHELILVLNSHTLSYIYISPWVVKTTMDLQVSSRFWWMVWCRGPVTGFPTAGGNCQNRPGWSMETGGLTKKNRGWMSKSRDSPDMIGRYRLGWRWLKAEIVWYHLRYPVAIFMRIVFTVTPRDCSGCPIFIQINH